MSLLEGHSGPDRRRTTPTRRAPGRAPGGRRPRARPDNAAILVYQLVDLLQVIGQNRQGRLPPGRLSHRRLVSSDDAAQARTPRSSLSCCSAGSPGSGAEFPPSPGDRPQGRCLPPSGDPKTRYDPRRSQAVPRASPGLRLTLGELAHHWADLAADAGRPVSGISRSAARRAELGAAGAAGAIPSSGSSTPGTTGPASRPVGGLPGHELSDTNPPDTLKTMAAFDALADGGACWLTEVQAPPLATGRHAPSWLDEAESAANQARPSAGALGPSTLLLRLSLSRLDKRFLWTATRRRAAGDGAARCGPAR